MGLETKKTKLPKRGQVSRESKWTDSLYELIGNMQVDNSTPESRARDIAKHHRMIFNEALTHIDSLLYEADFKGAEPLWYNQTSEIINGEELGEF